VRIGVLGTGTVGQTIGAKVEELGHDVVIGTRDVEEALARTKPPQPWVRAFGPWHAEHPGVAVGTFREAATHGEIVFNATAGAGSLEALELAGGGTLDGKVVVDISNPLDFSTGTPRLTVVNDDSLGEQIQRAFPSARVVKSLNTVTAAVMVDPQSVGDGDHHAFVSGDDTEAKAQVTRILMEWFGWRNVIDLGDITTARGVEMYLPLWIRLMGALGSPMINLKIVM
jgi:8-hydroxy-5-deazaflavin:NADPH oxidoreductase